MSLKDKKGLVDLSSLGTKRRRDERRTATGVAVAPEVESGPASRGPRTALGLHAATLYSDAEVRRENELLKQRVEAFDGALPVRQLDAKKVRASKWANRMEQSFQSPLFRALEEEIVAAGGNVQPIKVRPVEGTDE